MIVEWTEELRATIAELPSGIRKYAARYQYDRRQDFPAEYDDPEDGAIETAPARTQYSDGGLVCVVGRLCEYVVEFRTQRVGDRAWERFGLARDEYQMPDAEAAIEVFRRAGVDGFVRAEVWARLPTALAALIDLNDAGALTEWDAVRRALSLPPLNPTDGEDR